MLGNQPWDKQARDNRASQFAKGKLADSIKKSIDTTMIGAIARFEDAFGELWGHGKDERDLNEVELAARETWNIVRTSVMDNGNTQLRMLVNSLDRYVIKFNRFSIKFVTKRDNKE